ncbi:MAG: glycosyltransferase [Pseudomonadota bacterium]
MTTSNKASPLISVYMATKNRAQLLCRAIDSVLAQDYENFELIIVDDGSNDNTPSKLLVYQQQNSNISFYRNEKSLGVAAARNLAIEQSKGEFVTGLDDDDYFYNNRLSSLMSAYDDQYAFICSSSIWDFGNHKTIADKKTLVFSLRQQLSYNHATTQVLVKRERMIAIGGFDVNMVARLDYDAWTRLMICYGNSFRINHPSYVISRNDGIERITGSPNNIIGNHQFLNKHKERMNTRNLYNWAFFDIYAQQKPFGIKLLLQQLWAGNVMMKLKYFIRRNFIQK